MINEVDKRLQEVISLFCTETVPLEIVESWRNTEKYTLQDYVSMHLKPEVEWSTAIGVIEAALTVLQEAMCNGNINEDGSLKG